MYFNFVDGYSYFIPDRPITLVKNFGNSKKEKKC